MRMELDNDDGGKVLFYQQKDGTYCVEISYNDGGGTGQNNTCGVGLDAALSTLGPKARGEARRRLRILKGA